MSGLGPPTPPPPPPPPPPPANRTYFRQTIAPHLERYISPASPRISPAPHVHLRGRSFGRELRRRREERRARLYGDASDPEAQGDAARLRGDAAAPAEGSAAAREGEEGEEEEGAEGEEEDSGEGAEEEEGPEEEEEELEGEARRGAQAARGGGRRGWHRAREAAHGALLELLATALEEGARALPRSQQACEGAVIREGGGGRRGAGGGRRTARARANRCSCPAAPGV